MIYNDTVHPHYDEQKEKATQLLEQIEAKQSKYNREGAIKLLKTLSNEKYKQGSQAQKSFNKGNIGKDEFLQQYIDSRKEFYQIQTYVQIVAHAPEAQV